MFTDCPFWLWLMWYIFRFKCTKNSPRLWFLMHKTEKETVLGKFTSYGQRACSVTTLNIVGDCLEVFVEYYGLSNRNWLLVRSMLLGIPATHADKVHVRAKAPFSLIIFNQPPSRVADCWNILTGEILHPSLHLWRAAVMEADSDRRTTWTLLDTWKEKPSCVSIWRETVHRLFSDIEMNPHAQK